MRVLLKDTDDGTLFVVSPAEVNYDPIDHTLTCVLNTRTTYSVCGMDLQKAQDAIKTLYHTGIVDLTQYRAAFSMD